MDTASDFGSKSDGSARWSLRVLGGFELCARPGGEKLTALGKRERVLLASLALSPNGRHPRRKLATLLWGNATDETALDNLRTCVWSLRKALGDAERRVIARDGEDIALEAGALEVDALAFRRLAAQSGRAELDAAAKIYAGDFLDGLGIDNEEFESWRREEAGRFKDQAIDVLSRLMTQLAEAGETEHAIEAGKRILHLEPLHEPAVRRLMRLYGGSGRRGGGDRAAARSSYPPRPRWKQSRGLLGRGCPARAMLRAKRRRGGGFRPPSAQVHRWPFWPAR